MTQMKWAGFKRKLLIIGMAAASFIPADGQQISVRVTADEAVAAALAGSRTLTIAKLDAQAAAARFKETDAIFLPQAGISYAAMTTNNPLNAFGFKLQQKTISQSDFAPDLLNHPGGTPDFMTSLDLQQPLINMDQVYQRKAAGAEAEVYRLKGQRAEANVIYEARRAYMQLQFAYRAQRVMKDALETARALYRYTSDRAAQGLLSRADELNIEVRVKTTESNLAEAGSQVMNASDYLGLCMGRSPGTQYSVDTSDAATIAPTNSDAGNMDVAGPGMIVPEDRADLAALRKAIQASDLMVKSTKMSSLPRLNAFGSYQLNDSRMLGFGAGAYLAGLRLSWDLFKGNSIAHRKETLSLERSRLKEQYALYREQSQTELNITRRKLGDASFRIAQQQAAVASAAESYRILRDRYEQGLAGSTDVLLAQTQVAQQQLALVQAIFDRDVTMAYIEFLMPSTIK